MPRQQDMRLDRIQQHLFATDKNKNNLPELTTEEQEAFKRWRLAINRIMETPELQTKDLVQWLRAGCGGLCEPVGQGLAYRDASIVAHLVGQFQLTINKDWTRHMVVEMCKEAFSLAKKQNDPKGMVMAADKIGKYCRIDQESADLPNFADMTPPSFEPSDDVTLLGFTPDPDIEKRRIALRKAMKSSKVDVQDAEVL